MRIRSITFFTTANADGKLYNLDNVNEAVKLGKRGFNLAGFEVQTIRLATQSFSQYFPDDVKKAVKLAQEMEKDSAEEGFSFLSIGPAFPSCDWAFSLIPDLLAGTQNVFCTAVIANRAEGISLPAIKACGKIIAQNTLITPDGFTNLRFAALANVPAHAPFFPAGYHDNGTPGFSLAIECADVAYKAMHDAENIQDGARAFQSALESIAKPLEPICLEITKKTGLAFFGFDFSPAPFPVDTCSLGGAMEATGTRLGKLGAVASAALLASALEKGKWKKAGFNGMMMPVLEDSILARRTEESSFGIKDLLLYSTMCGTGLDTVPLPGDATAEQLSAVLLDVAAIAIRLNKPLTARLMPIPGKKAGDMTGFDFEYFANGRVMNLEAQPLTGIFSGDEIFTILPRQFGN
jgi:uncharacterized protein (UPF0210 family)